jgi:DNA-binding transcriptional regulator YiaG
MSKNNGPGLTPETIDILSSYTTAQRKAFAKALGCDERTVRNWASKASAPTAKMTKRIERRLGVKA